MVNRELQSFKYLLTNGKQNGNGNGHAIATNGNHRFLPEILFISSFPPRECGIATYSYDLVNALNRMFDHSFAIRICPLESEYEQHAYSGNMKYSLNTDLPGSYFRLAEDINGDADVKMVLLQHEFGFFRKTESEFGGFLRMLNKPLIIVFHTVLPNPGEPLRLMVREMASIAASVIVMTRSSAEMLGKDYDVPAERISVIPHGTHLVPHSDKKLLKQKYNLTGRTILSTFGLLSSGKNIETTLQALPAIIKHFPETLFLVIGKTHPSVVKEEGEQYRNKLELLVQELGIEQHVQFINCFLPLPDLLEYLQLTDIYLFTSRDRNQAVSGTFSYAISCGCPVVSTPIPHAREVLEDGAGMIIDFEHPGQLSEAVNSLLDNAAMRNTISSRGLHKMASTAWENAAVAHAMLFSKTGAGAVQLHYSIPVLNLEHFKKLTTGFGMIQFSRINQPDLDSGYTLDDNARALIALCRHYELTNDQDDISYIYRYFLFIQHCLQPGGFFLNYVNEQEVFTIQNYQTNLADANGRAVWALGYLVSMGHLLPNDLWCSAKLTLNNALAQVKKIHATRAMAFIIKGLYYRNAAQPADQDVLLIRELANRLLQMYRHEADQGWQWYESYLTYANSILPEAMLCAWQATGDEIYKEVARNTFDFLLGLTFSENQMRVISNKNWFFRGAEPTSSKNGPVVTGGEQPIDVAYTVLALARFYEVFKDETYRQKMDIAFSWFLGNNHLHQIMYNPCTGGCYDGLEEHSVNLNQGAESTVSYLLARLTAEQYLVVKEKVKQKTVQFLSTAVS